MAILSEEGCQTERSETTKSSKVTFNPRFGKHVLEQKKLFHLCLQHHLTRGIQILMHLKVAAPKNIPFGYHSFQVPKKIFKICKLVELTHSF